PFGKGQPATVLVNPVPKPEDLLLRCAFLRWEKVLKVSCQLRCRSIEALAKALWAKYEVGTAEHEVNRVCGRGLKEFYCDPSKFFCRRLPPPKERRDVGFFGIPPQLAVSKYSDANTATKPCRDAERLVDRQA